MDKFFFLSATKEYSGGGNEWYTADTVRYKRNATTVEFIPVNIDPANDSPEMTIVPSRSIIDIDGNTAGNPYTPASLVVALKAVFPESTSGNAEPGTVDLTDYYTKGQADAKYLTSVPDLSGTYATQTQSTALNSAISTNTTAITGNTSAITRITTRPSARLGSLGNRRIAGFGSRPAFVGTGAVSDGVQTIETSRFRYKAIGNLFDLSVVYINSPGNINSTAVTTTGDVTITASLEYPSGTFTQITFSNNNTSCVLKRGQRIVSDSILCDIADGADFWVRTCVTVTAGVIFPKFWATASGYNEGALAGSDATMTGTITNSSSNTFGASAIIGNSTTSKATIANIGDSLSSGQSDSGTAASNPNLYGGGIYGRAFGQNYPTLIMNIAGQSIAQWATNKARLTHLFATCQYFICQLGINDCRSSDVQATIQANYIALWDILRSIGIYGYQTTITPNTTSTDSWATTANQTPFATNNCNTKRIAINDWIRDGAPINVSTRVAVATGDASGTTVRAGDPRHPLLGYFEVADTVESARNSGIWKAPNYTTDGLHGTSTSYPLMAAAIDTTKFLLW